MLESQTYWSEALLVQSLQMGNEDAFQVLFQQYHESMLRLAAAIVHEMSAAEDVVQETWLAVVKAIRNFEGRSTIKTWLFSIVMNRARSYIKREQRLTSRVKISLDAQEGTTAEYVMPHQESYPEAVAEIHEFQHMISQTIDRLPLNQRNVVRLRDLHGLSAAEVSQQLGISDANQRVLLHRARKQMRTKLTDY